MLSTRMLALFYGFWKKHRIEHAVCAPEDAFLPLLLALAGLLGGCGAPWLSYEVALVLGSAALRPARLGPDGARLGVDGWLPGAAAGADRADLRYLLRPLAPLPGPEFPACGA